MQQSLLNINVIRANWKSGLTIALISLPVAISLAVASGVNPVTGIITAIWVGFIGSLLGGSDYTILSMTGALSSFVAAYALMHGPENIPSLAIVSGIVMLIAYFAKLERYLIFIPSSVIHGFTLGIALVIMLTQLNGAFGLEKLPKHPQLLENSIESFKHLHQMHLPALAFFCIFLIALFLLKKIIPSIPGAIIISPIGIALGYATTQGILPFSLQTLGGQFGAVKPALVQIPCITFTTSLIVPALTIAFVAILEAMLAAKLADVLTKTKHNPRKQMFGLALANIVSGLVGGIPTTAALAQTSYNIKAHATSYVSGIIGSICLVIISFLFLSYFTYMPMAVIAAILVFIAFNMIEREHFNRLYEHDKSNFFIALLVAGLMVYEDAIVGILAGAVVALLLLVNKLAESYYEVSVHETSKEPQETLDAAQKCHVLIYAFKGKLVYLNSQAHMVRFQTAFTEYAQVILELQNIYYIDLDGVDALEEIIELIENRKQTVRIVAPTALHITNMLLQSKRFKKLHETGCVFNSLSDTL